MKLQQIGKRYVVNERVFCFPPHLNAVIMDSLKKHVSTTKLNCLVAELQEVCIFILFVVNMDINIRNGNRRHWPVPIYLCLCDVYVLFVEALYSSLFYILVTVLRLCFTMEKLESTQRAETSAKTKITRECSG